jgi:hypothetical protein
MRIDVMYHVKWSSGGLPGEAARGPESNVVPPLHYSGTPVPKPKPPTYLNFLRQTFNLWKPFKLTKTHSI